MQLSSALQLSAGCCCVADVNDLARTITNVAQTVVMCKLVSLGTPLFVVGGMSCLNVCGCGCGWLLSVSFVNAEAVWS